MDFIDSATEATFRGAVRTWLEQHATASAPASTGKDADPVAVAQRWQACKADAGWAGIHWPVEYGGRGGSAVEQVIWEQEESAFDVPPDIFVLGIGIAGPTIMAHGRQDQKDRYLPPMLRGEEIWCQLFSEPDAGSDLANVRTAATRDGDEWVVNGQKVWTSGAQYSRWGTLICRTDPRLPKHQGLTYFVVDMESEGIEVRPIRQITGEAHFNEVFFHDVRLPDTNRIGEIGDGWRVAITTLMNERAASTSMGVAGPSVGIPELLECAQASTMGGRPAIEDSAVRQRLAELIVRSEAMRHTSYRVLTALSQDEQPGPAGSVGKLVLAELTQSMADLALELQGPRGLLTQGVPNEGRWQRSFLTAPAVRIAGGTDEIQRNIIGERVLGLPPDARPDKGKPFASAQG